MAMDGVRSSVESITNDLRSVEERRERLIKGTRDVIMLCSKAIVALHGGKDEEASQQATAARTLLDELRHVAEEDLQRYIISAETELVEANALQAIISGNSIPSLESLRVNGRSYVLGLLDCVGELKRLVFNRIRTGSGDEAKNLFTLMEQIYALLFPLASYDHVVPGVRRKLDVARFLIEDTRAVITEESRRGLMLDAMDRLYKKLEDDQD